MDLNDLRSLFTVVVVVMFIAIVFWAYSSKQKASFDEAAQLALDDDTPTRSDENSGKQHK